MTIEAQVTWCPERREAVESIIKATKPDVFPSKPFRLWEGAGSLSAAPVLEQRTFQVWTGALAAGGPVQLVRELVGSSMVVDTTCRVDIRYQGTQGLTRQFVVDTNDMMASDEQKLLWGLNPQNGYSGSIWGIYAPLKHTLSTVLVEESPEMREGSGVVQKPWMILRLFFNFRFVIGEANNN